MAFTTEIIQAGVSIFGLFNMDPALLAFAMIIILFGVLNLLEFKKFW
ncbi:MAG: hypothetical protein HKO02_15555 [Hyphomonadaceae bacterium]|nr:hypothetical protein [Hyphomonadaceae bacterium]